MRTFSGISILILFLFPVSFIASAEDDFKKWMQQEKQTFQEYKDKRDKEFTAFLQTQWREMNMLKGFVRDETPKPVKLPVAKPVPVKPIDKDIVKPVPEPVVTKPPVPIPSPVVIAPKIKPPAVVPKGRKISFSYYGTPLTFYYDPSLNMNLSPNIDKDAVSNFWSGLSKSDYDLLINQIDSSAKALNLNDWAYVVLVYHVAKEIYRDENRQSLFIWFTLAKSGYKARIAYSSSTIFLLVPTQQQLFSMPYFTFDKIKYYAVRFDGKEQKLGKVYTYDGQYPGTDKNLDMRMNENVLVATKPINKVLSFEYAGKKYNINAPYDKSRIDFLKTYPQLDIRWYFQSAVSRSVASPLLTQLSSEIKGMTNTEAVNLLLRFVQTSFEYKTDDGQFGEENYLFPEETIHYPYSDCEDRAVIFAWLVRSLLDLDVIGLNLPGHVATAVLIPGNSDGDTVAYDGKRYLVSDPTFINATAGMMMPDYKNTKPDIVKIR